MNFTLHFYQIRILTIITIDPFKREICIFAKKKKKKKEKEKNRFGSNCYDISIPDSQSMIYPYPTHTDSTHALYSL